MGKLNIDGQQDGSTLEYLFVSGCARTGTTGIVNLLNQLPEVAIGLERYKGIANKKRIDEYKPHLFGPSRFFDFREGETNLLPRSPVHAEFYGRLQEKFRNGTIRFIGEKVPFLFRFFRQIEGAFFSPKWVMMLRDPKSVAASYELRSQTPDDAWPETHDCRMSVRHWNESVEAIEAMAKELPGRVFVCEYERIYSGDIAYLETLVRFLNLPMSGHLVDHYRIVTADWAERVRSQRRLSIEQREFVQETAAIEAYERILAESFSSESRHGDIGDRNCCLT
ncbi:MAG: sulfotransferase [bacterium]|nr:sulfotransferase [bacterium]